jgi:hypothetical protein
VISLTPRPLYPRSPLDRRLGGPHSQYGRCGVQNDIESSSGHPAFHSPANRVRTIGGVSRPPGFLMASLENVHLTTGTTVSSIEASEHGLRPSLTADTSSRSLPPTPHPHQFKIKGKRRSGRRRVLGWTLNGRAPKPDTRPDGKCQSSSASVRGLTASPRRVPPTSETH